MLASREFSLFFLTVRFLSFSHTNHMECLISRAFLNISHKTVTICAVIHINVTYLYLTSRPHWEQRGCLNELRCLPLNKIRATEATIC
ncbi:hypothetical protein E3I81_15270 [Salmonella enterica]|uniref:Uncharacterized protein n=2 Tax=Salmonella enterica TaxID=28901 RepID=A0A5T3Z5F3_SALER|nr:hypothetical protein [Salmonella enterica]ECB4705533.1 hypothetical protein [Salmonella enterica subsp. enterica serovar Typhi]MBW8071029.1 hypothetical protein [Salmonella enterica subsp. enterica serovar Fulica]HAC6528523.1 hypothetical protein [Salmonella enterica subsp. enterica]HAD4236301.1 hypothetical protein [Salmonella enterica subsp. enterica serovar Typhi str. CT18]HAD7336492.1 hypothetical protein [Salmonella enterica subsp. enterica serovar Typhi str. 404ty]